MTRRRRNAAPATPDGGPWALLTEILRGHHDLQGAACVGRHALFDPPEPGESVAETRWKHRAAAAVCRTCPVLHRCQTWADTQPGDGMVRAAVEPDPRRGRPTDNSLSTRQARSS